MCSRSVARNSGRICSWNTGVRMASWTPPSARVFGITYVRSALAPGRVRVLALCVDLPQIAGLAEGMKHPSACPAPVLYACDVTPDERAVVVRAGARRGAAGRLRDPCTVSERPGCQA